MEKNEQYRVLFHKYINDTLDKDELDLLTSMIDSEEYEEEMDACFREYFQLSDNNKDQENLKIKSVPIVEETWKQLNLKINEEHRVIEFPKHRISPVLKYAAAVLLLMSISTVWYYIYNKAKVTSQEQVASADIFPGTNRATLTLSNGNAIALSEGQEGLVVGADQMTYADGTTIMKTPEVQLATISTPRSGQYQVTLPDGSKAWLNAASSINYPTQFIGENRQVKITGEVYFEITKNPKKPFIVQSNNQFVKVLGTSFNINAYGDKGQVITTLVEGSVQVSSDQNNAVVKIKPGQQAILSSNGELQTRVVDTDEYASWKDGLYMINNLSLEDFGKKIERWYDVEVDMGPFKEQKLSATIRRDVKLNEVLEAIELNTKIKFKVKDRKVTAYK
ncbi:MULTISPECIES: FecR family protein [unclassified Sphingobacterium]|uniref:FecR family protein n=1 Tax=unclassified Sphingobacterium TaxID=2609468 RepID=UPI0020C34CAD|nr:MULTISPECIES: FecR family protein [unclassified Sphingobacterium]